jgi:hypothetical protein
VKDRDTILAILLFLLGFSICLRNAHAEVQITWELVCKAQDALRWGLPPWSIPKCESVAAALNASDEPDILLGICINESDLRALAVRWVRSNLFDGGLCGVRCEVQNGKCINGPAKGYTARALLDPATNARIAGAILKQKRARYGTRGLDAYNGSFHRGYSKRILTIVAALGGVQIPVKTQRMREITRRLIAAVVPRLAEGEGR